MNFQDKILKAIKEGLNTAFNFDDIVDTQLDDIKKEPTKNTAKSVKYKWLYPILTQLVNDVLSRNKITLTIKEQNSLFAECVKCGIYYLFPDYETFKKFIKSYCQENTKANLNWIDTSNITDMHLLFWCSEFNGDISAWDVSNVTDMSCMFIYSKFNGDISKWNVSGVTDMCYMFNRSCFNGDISQWDVSSVIKMTYMFYKSNFNRDISKWDVSSVTEMTEMFCNSIFNSDISSWNVSNVTRKFKIFNNCPIKEEYKPIFINEFTG